MAEEKKSPTPPAKPTFKYNVSNLASDLDIQPASVRIILRKHKIEKTEGVYGWNKHDDYKAVLAKLKAKSEKVEKDDKTAAKKPTAKIAS